MLIVLYVLLFMHRHVWTCWGFSVVANVTATSLKISILTSKCGGHTAVSKNVLYKASHWALSPGANANMDRDSPVEARAVTSDRRRVKYCERIVTVGRNVRQ